MCETRKTEEHQEAEARVLEAMDAWEKEHRCDEVSKDQSENLIEASIQRVYWPSTNQTNQGEMQYDTEGSLGYSSSLTCVRTRLNVRSRDTAVDLDVFVRETRAQFRNFGDASLHEFLSPSSCITERF
jgi:hypothetical protein